MEPETKQPINFNEMTPQQQGDMLRGYKFSKEEMKVLQDCNAESFYKRSLPLSTFLGLVTHQAVKMGYLKRNARFGAAPKVALSVIFGYFVGKFSYQEKCAAKLMALPDSFIGQVLRERKSKGIFGGGGFDTTPSISGFGSVITDVYSDVYKDAGPNSSLDLDTDRPLFKGLEDTYKPSVDNFSDGKEEMPLPKTPGMTYDELRKKNRDEQASAKPQTPYKVLPVILPSTNEVKPEPRGRRNVYGDSFDE